MEATIDQIRSSPYQPRLYFKLETIKESIMQDGMLVAPLVRRKPDAKTESLYKTNPKSRRIAEGVWVKEGKTTIELNIETRDKLKELGKKGETYDEIIKSLLELAKQKEMSK